jgi:hypothetical protein
MHWALLSVGTAGIFLRNLARKVGLQVAAKQPAVRWWIEAEEPSAELSACKQ